MPMSKESADALRKMQAASDAFYIAAVRTNAHAFIEFTGLMNEYIKVCRSAAENSDDSWMMANTHNETLLPFKPFHLSYLAEKLDCIYGPAVRSSPQLAQVLLATDR